MLQVLIVKASLLTFWIEGFVICHDCGSSLEDPNTIFVLRCTGKKNCILTDYCVFEKDRVLGEMRVISMFSTRYSMHFLEAIRQKLALNSFKTLSARVCSTPSKRRFVCCILRITVKSITETFRDLN